MSGKDRFRPHEAHGAYVAFSTRRDFRGLARGLRIVSKRVGIFSLTRSYWLRIRLTRGLASQAGVI